MKQLYPFIAIVLLLGLFIGSVSWTIHKSNSGMCTLRAKHAGPIKAFD